MSKEGQGKTQRGAGFPPVRRPLAHERGPVRVNANFHLESPRDKL